MGQRSQVYVKVNIENENRLIARYFQSCFLDEMISRTKHTIHWIKRYFTMAIYNYNEFERKLTQIIETDFDTVNTKISSDLIQEWKEIVGENYDETFFREQDNNDGQLYLQININKKDKTSDMKYCLYWPKEDIINDPDEYIDEELKSMTITKEDLPEYNKNNIKWIKHNCEMMTRKELEEFFNTNYINTL